MTGDNIIPHLFRTEYSKIVAVITKSFGLEHLGKAEEIVSETFLLALETWPYKGMPANPNAWLYTVAKNKFVNHIVRNNIFKTKVSGKLYDESPFVEIGIDFSDKNISDSQLQMLFTICHPSISTEAQICLALRILCGLGINEIADAFLTKKETIQKRIQRGKEKLNLNRIEIEMPDNKEINERIETVLRTIYLLFSEGYYSENHNSIIRSDLCVEALNLTYLLLGNPITNNHSTNALMSLMCFQSSRLEARKSDGNNLILYDNQDRQLWDREFIEKGFHYLQQAAKWELSSKYYIEASIAYWHTVENNNSDKWPCILKLYDALRLIDKSPIISLNRIWAFSKVHGNIAAVNEAEKLDLKTSHFYFILLAELSKTINIGQSLNYLKKAIGLCKTVTEKEFLSNQIELLERMLDSN